MIIPGFVPDPIGSVVEYSPSSTEVVISVGIWALGLLIFTWMLRIAIPIMTGAFHVQDVAPAVEEMGRA